MANITDTQIQSYQEDGALLLKNVFSQEWINKIKIGIQKNLDNPSKYSENLRAPGGPGFYFNDYCNWQDIQEFTDFVHKSPAAELAGKLMKSEYAVFYHDHVLTKDPGTYKVTPWHHDQSYYPVDGFKNCSLWIPVDYVPEESAIEFIKYSHQWGKWFYPKKFATENNYKIEGQQNYGKEYSDVPDIDNHRQDYDILRWECQPGDCIAFHMKTLHGAPVNKQGTSRRVLSARWLGDDAVIAERPWEVSPPITDNLKPGDKVISQRFPVVWRKEI